MIVQYIRDFELIMLDSVSEKGTESIVRDLAMQESYIRNCQIRNFKEVGKGAVIRAGSVVTRATPDNAIAVRVPTACSGNA